MRHVFGSRKRRDAQTLVFFLLAWGTIMLLCGLAIDSGLLYLSKARLSRAVDGAALAAVGNFNRSGTPTVNRDDVATIMRNFAVANFTDLSTISTVGSTVPGGVASSYTLPTGGLGTQYTYNFNDGTQDANGAYRRYVQVVLSTGSSGAITSATCNARCPVQTYFIGYGWSFLNGQVARNGKVVGGYTGVSGLADLKVSSTAVATRNPRLIMVVVDRSASMLQPGGGAYGLPQAVVQFLDFFDTSSDYIGIVSFGTSARLEMPLTTNFINAATNILFDAYDLDSNEVGYDSLGNSYTPVGVPGPDPEEFSTNSDYDQSYATTGVRRLKFGGQTAADEGIRLAMEEMMANSGFNDPNTIKYMVIFTDGKWNEMRTLVAAPPYTNTIMGPPPATNSSTIKWLTNTSLWSTNLAADANLIPVPTMSPLPYVTNAIAQTMASGSYAVLATNHLADEWQSQDGPPNEPLNSTSGAQLVGDTTNFITTNTFLYKSGTTNCYARNIDVWLQPGAVDYVYLASLGGKLGPYYVSYINNPTYHVNIMLNPGDSNVLVVPGYVTDGCVYDGIDLPWSGFSDTPGYPAYRADNYQQPFMWPDDTVPVANATDINNYLYGGVQSQSLERQLMFRNYVNLLTGFYVNKPDEPLSTQTEPLDDTTPATQRPLNGLGPYYPSAPFYWPFDLVGVDYDATYDLTNATMDPDVSGQGLSRHATYSINMLSTNATPEWYGELFYKSTTGGGTNSYSGTGTTSVSAVMTAADWQNNAPAWLLNDFNMSGEGVMTNEPTHDTNISPNPSVWRPTTYMGTQIENLATIVPGDDPLCYTGGYIQDGNGNYWRNAMAWSGRPTHYFDFSQDKWVAIASNHSKNSQFLGICEWKAREYAWHARALGVTIYTVGYGSLVYPEQQVLLAQIANSTNTTAGNPQTFNGTYVTNYLSGPGTAITYNPSQPIGQQFYATNTTDISNDFYQVGQAINAALTQ